jgi:two-component system sensor histidine kinase/response regulator
MDGRGQPVGSEHATARLLIVDDEPALMTALCSTLELEGYATTGCSSARSALQTLASREFDILLTDMMMPDMDGIELLSRAQQIDRNLVGVVMTGHGTIDTAVKALQAGALDYVVKPFRLDNLIPVLTRAMATRRLQTENVRLRERLEERTRELEAINADLESFSYSVSHDLRAPLRAIDGFCDILVTDYGGSIPQEATEYLGKVSAGVARMQRLIDDLLHLARFSRVPLETHEVKMTELARRVIAGIEGQWPDRRVVVELPDLPDCCADGSLLEQVLINLISNAFKFTSTRDESRVVVGAFEEGEEQVYFVRDNGVGFDMKHADRLFGVFQRMHSQAQFAGTGIGLSIVQRIIRRHGGRTWAESKLREGTTVYFSLPIIQPCR